MHGTQALTGLAGRSGVECTKLALTANDRALDATRYSLHSALPAAPNPARDADAHLRRLLALQH